LYIEQLNQCTNNDIQCSLAQFDVDINSPNENNGTTMPVINHVKEWIRSPWTQDV
jgi:hypothetical protein